MAINLIHATSETFSEYVGDEFTVHMDDRDVTFRLDNIKLFKTTGIRDNHLEIDGVVYPPRNPFALTFEGPREPVLESKTYKLSHDKIGEVELFISGFRQDQDCMLYESCFN